MRLGLVDRALLGGDLAADAVDGGLLGGDLGARGVHRDAIIAVVDPEDHVAGVDHGVVAGKDRGDVARHPRAERGVVGAHIGVVGGNVEASDQHIVEAIACRGERDQRDEPHQDQPAFARFRRGACSGRRRSRRPLDRRLFDRGACRRLGVATRGLIGKMRPKLLGKSRCVARGVVAPGRILPGTNDARGLVSRCGHQGLPIKKSRCMLGPERASLHRQLQISIDRTVRSSYIRIAGTLGGQFLPSRFQKHPKLESFQRA